MEAFLTEAETITSHALCCCLLPGFCELLDLVCSNHKGIDYVLHTFCAKAGAAYHVIVYHHLFGYNFYSNYVITNDWLRIHMAGRSVRVFTVASESRYIVVRNIPALGVIEDLLKRLSLYGKVCEYRLLDHADDRQAALQFEGDANDDDDEFTDTVWVQYETVNNARHAKVRGVQKPFYGNRLQISYAPQFESREDTANKLAQRRQLLLRRARPNAHHTTAAMSNNKKQASSHPSLAPSLPFAAAEDKTTFIGPQLPSSYQQSVPKLHKVMSSPQHLQLKQAVSEVARQQQNTKRRRI